RDADGLLHPLAAVDAGADLTGYLPRQQLFIADGHHRYETALTYQAQVRDDPRQREAAPGALPADWVMMVLINAELEELEIRATHRLIRGVDEHALHGMVAEPGPLFQALPMAPQEVTERLRELRGAEEPVFGVLLEDGSSYLSIGERDGRGARRRRDQARRGLHRAGGNLRRDPPARAPIAQAPPAAGAWGPHRVVVVVQLRGLLRRAGLGGARHELPRPLHLGPRRPGFDQHARLRGR